ncbi:MAG TPA: tetratricopeptide repeat protein, partial [Gammaproteobacteria bacterium]|nr:tetratricopeptide repeat protein [Gammaproteobacteria bacterium]
MMGLKMSHKIIGVPLSLCLALNMVASHAGSHVDFGDIVQDKARYWQSLGRDDKATEAWGKILLSMPENQEAILWLGINNAYAGNAEVAQRYLIQLEQSGAKKSSIAVLKRAIKMGPPEASYLKQARIFAKEKKIKDAVAQYNLAFHNVKPTGHLAVEYYQTVASLPDGWEEAGKGFKTLSEAFPQQLEYQYIYARHLSYKESTRRKAIDRLSQLASTESPVSERAAQDWYQALVWLQFKKGDQRYFADYLKRFPDNKVIKGKQKTLKRLVHGPSERDSRLKQAYVMMEEGDLDGAEAEFDDLVHKDRSDAEALAGRAILDLKKEHFESAVQGLERAIKLEPEFRSEWQPPLTEARFWLLMKQSEMLRNQSDLDQAEKVLKRANKLLPNNVYGRMALADVLVDKGDLRQSRKIYSDIVKNHPSNLDAKVGLAHVLAALGEQRATFSLLDEIEAIEPQKAAEVAQLRTQFLVKDALAANDDGKRQDAISGLEEQLVVAPNNPWVRLDLARAYRAQGALEKANSLLDGLLVTHSDMPAVLYARALLFEQEGKNIEGMVLLEKISVGQRSGDMRQLQHRLWVKAQTERASILAGYGQIELAYEVLDKVTPVVERERELIGLLASAWSDLGNTDRALELLRKGKPDDLDLQLNYASVLLHAGQDTEGELVVKKLLAQKLSQSQQAQLADLVIGHSIKRANEAREQGDFALAYDYLAPVMFQYGDDDRIVLSMASLFASADENKRALSLYRQVLA